jgi:hypothetical protein
VMAERLRKDRRKRKAARRGQRAGTLIRELERKLPATVIGMKRARLLNSFWLTRSGMQRSWRTRSIGSTELAD